MEQFEAKVETGVEAKIQAEIKRRLAERERNLSVCGQPEYTVDPLMLLFRL